MNRDELRERVRAKLLENGSPSNLVDRVVREGFFAREDGLLNLARALDVLGADEQVSS